MAGKGVAAQRDELVEVELRGIRESLARLEAALGEVSASLDGVRVTELAGVRAAVSDVRALCLAESAKHDKELTLLRYQMGRTAAMWSAITGIVMTAIGGAIMALVLRR